MDPETGIGSWTEEQFVKAVRFSITPHGTNKYPMEPYSALTDKEASAVYAYLKNSSADQEFSSTKSLISFLIIR